MIFNIHEIRNIVLDHLQFVEENYSLFMFYGNHNYFKRRFKNISKTDAITIYQKSQTIDLNFHFLIQFHCLFKTMFNPNEFQKMLQTPWKKQSDGTVFLNDKWYLKTTGLTLELNSHNQIFLEQMLNQKIKQFCKRFQKPLKEIKCFRFYNTREGREMEWRFCASLQLTNHAMETFTLNTQKELSLSSYSITIDSNLHTRELLPSLDGIGIWIKKNINLEVHIDHDPSIPTNLRFLMYLLSPSPTILLKIEIPHQNLSISAQNCILKTRLFQKFPFKFFTEEIEFISKFKKDHYAMPNFKCITRIDSINKGIIRVTIEEDIYYITLKNKAYFQCIGFQLHKNKLFADNFISFYTSEIPTHWKHVSFHFDQTTNYEIKWNTISSNLRKFNIYGGTMIKKNNKSTTGTISWSDIPQDFAFTQISIFLTSPFRKFNFLSNPAIITEQIKKNATFYFNATRGKIPILPIPINHDISGIRFFIEKFDRIRIHHKNYIINYGKQKINRDKIQADFDPSFLDRFFGEQLGWIPTTIERNSRLQ